MRCKYCNARLASHDLWCVECGRQTNVVNSDLSALASLKETYRSFRSVASASVPGAAFAVIFGFLPIAVLLYLFNGIIGLDNGTVSGTLLNLLTKSLSISIFVPFILIAFQPVCAHRDYRLSLKEMSSALKSYPQYLGFALINALFFDLVYIVCFGLPNFSSHPILRLVWIVLVNYWIAISLPAAALIPELNVNPWKAIKLSYRHFHDVRWNIYLLCIVLGILLAISILLFFLLLIPLVLCLALVLYAVRDYVRKLISFELLDYRR